MGLGLEMGLGMGMVLGLGLGTGLALGLRVGWVLCITARSYSNQSFALAEDSEKKQNRAENHSRLLNLLPNPSVARLEH